jgi:hypothetical protein
MLEIPSPLIPRTRISTEMVSENSASKRGPGGLSSSRFLPRIRRIGVHTHNCDKNITGLRDKTGFLQNLFFPISLSFRESYLALPIMPGRSPKRTDNHPRKSLNHGSTLETGSDYRLVIVLGSALVLAIAIIIAIFSTTPV